TNSPAANSGSTTLAVDASATALTTDQRGEARVQSIAVDMGAFESDFVPAAAEGVLTFDHGAAVWRIGMPTVGTNTITWTDELQWNSALTWDVFMGDVDGNGFLDGIGINANNQVFVVLNDGAGNLTEVPMASLHTDRTYSHYLGGDFDGDGRFDFLTQGQEGLWFDRGWNGTAFETTFLGRWDPAGWDSFVAGDFNADGVDDIVGLKTNAAADGTTIAYGISQTVTDVGQRFDFRFAGRLGGTLADAGWHNVLVGDWNGDGRDDLAAQRGGGYFWYATSTGPVAGTDIGAHTLELTPGSFFDPTLFTNDFLVGDMNADGRDDIVTHVTNSGGSFDDALVVGLSEGPGAVSMSTSRWGSLDKTINWGNSLLIDQNADGRLDLLTFNLSSNSALVSQSSGSSLLAALDAGVISGTALSNRIAGQRGMVHATA
ncbi:MAG: VCBS repeat-containing protein, partial [Planctomycetaceae bacterium]|nr:VCBS repeat-containing protein [Planctomycetaceae bacterium]